MSTSTIEEIKARLDVADVVGQHVPLKKSGRSLKGLCPFHGEKTPSFYVFPETGTWHCFGCGEGGDIFSFLQKRENLDFVEALRLLAAKAGVELPVRDGRTPEARAADDRLQDALAAAELYFRAVLGGAAGAVARTYLERRGVNAQSVERFGLGYAPAAGLVRHLQEKGYRPEEILEVGLAGQREDGSQYEMFRERVMFPIRDGGGRTIGFGGRTLGDGQPKYLNGPQTRFFDKSGCLFALDLARPAIRESGHVVIVEGYFDALMAHQNGYANVVATLGTALTERHLERIGRRAAEIVLALDADAAGLAATLRGLGVEQNAPGDEFVPVPMASGRVAYQLVRHAKLKVFLLPPGLDPDELIRRDPAAWGRLAAAATPVVDFVLNRLGDRHDLASADGKREAVHDAMGILRDLTDPVVRDHYLQRLATIIGVDESGLRQALRRVRPRDLPSRGPQAAQSQPLSEAYALALHFLAGSPTSPLDRDDCSSPEARAVFELLAEGAPQARDREGLEQFRAAADPSLSSALDQVADWVSRLTDKPAEQRARELEVAALKLRQRRLRVQHQQVLTLLAEPNAREGSRESVSMLSSIAAQLRDIEAALAARDGIGSLVWRSRQVGEVFGG